MMTPPRTKDIWVFCDLRNKRLFDYSLRVLSKAWGLTCESSGNSVAIIMGPPQNNLHQDSVGAPMDDETVDVESAVNSCVQTGASKIYILEHPLFKTPRADVFSNPLCNFIIEETPKLMLFALTDLGRELAARCSMFCKSGLIADCMELSIENDSITGSCPAWGGEIMSSITFSDKNKTGFATVHPGIQADRKKVTAGKGSVKTIKIHGVKMPEGVRLIRSNPVPPSQRKLEDARRVVSGGAGLGSMENFALLREFAATIGAQTGATRPPVFQHWIDEDRLIGQTGKTIHPDLLISVGTSGAVQYTGGIGEVKIMVAINRDPNAPIFQIADIGIIADAPTFLPLLTDKAKQVLMRKLADTLQGKKENPGKKTGFGEKIRSLRERQNWSPEKLARVTGQTPQFIEDVESGEISPPVSFLVSLSGAFGVDSGKFLQQDEKSAIKNRRVQAHVRRANTYSYEVLTRGDENDHLRAFMITIDPHDSHKPVEYKHEGEEFIFVMEGDLEFTLDGTVSHLKKGAYIHFNSYIPHKLKNLSGSPTKCLVMLYTI